MELIISNACDSDNSIQLKKRFFNLRRNQGLCGEILEFLTVGEKVRIISTCKNFMQVKKQVEFKKLFDLFSSYRVLDVNDIKFNEIYDKVKSIFNKQILTDSSVSEKNINFFHDSLRYFTAGLINKFFIEPKRLCKVKKSDCANWNTPDLKSFSFYKGMLCNKDLSFLTDILKFNNSLISLTIRSCNVTDADLSLLLSSLKMKHNKTLEKLDLMYNEISDKGCEIIRDFLMENNHLKSLSIGMNNSITIKGLQCISFGLLTNRNLRSLSLQGLRMNKTHNKLIDTIITFNRSLEVLDLSNNEFDHISLNTWSNALIKNNSLHELILCGNCLKNISIRILTNILTQNQTLTSIDLRSNEINESCVSAIYSAIEKTKNLKKLELSGNCITPETLSKIKLKLNSR